MEAAPQCVSDATNAQCSADSMVTFYRQRVQRVEQELASTAAQKHSAHELLRRERHEHAAALTALQQRMQADLAEVQQRQAAVEEHGPVLQQQVSDAKGQLANIVISDAAYGELLSVPPEQRTLGDAVRVCVHENLLQLKKDNETLRRSGQARRSDSVTCADSICALCDSIK